MPNAKDLVIFTQTHDLLSWLLPQCEHFPKSQRFVVEHASARVDDRADQFQQSAVVNRVGQQ